MIWVNFPFQIFFYKIFLERNRCGDIVVDKKRIAFYICPTKKHTSLENRCCDAPEYNCCREATFYENNKLAILSTISIIAFTIFTIVIVICLCWEKCFLHKIVRRKPQLDYIGNIFLKKFCLTKPDEVEHLNGIYVPK
ncbi:unnamed protein product [Dracunculus medinensis]|uniref:CX domain-containing protein n=1 Tax=Dracunculus medinensis TaxID=318479 RepID=A0A0N4UC07_DRAME|nr:unnamed protein product [Dracunculus medinensis]